MDPANPLIVQSDGTILLEVQNPRYEEARDRLARFAEVVKSPEYVHTYRISPLSLWNAAATGMAPPQITEALEDLSKYDVPGNVLEDVRDYMSRYGRLKLIRKNGHLLLVSEDELLLTELEGQRDLYSVLAHRISPQAILIDPAARGQIKQKLVKLGWPVEDLAGYTPGEPLEVGLLDVSRSGGEFGLRDYQTDAVGAFHAGGTVYGGNGVIVMPCGAGKTMVGMGAIAALKCWTLIISTNTVAVRQWIDELRDKSTLGEDEIGEYTGDKKEVRPVTITTYQCMTWRPSKKADFPHLKLMTENNWGLIIYDEVHLLPAPVFRATTDIQARRRLGLTATLVREDGRESEVFSLIGPKRYDIPWKDLESKGWIAQALCAEIRVPMPTESRVEYSVATRGIQYRLAAENPAKIPILLELLARHCDDQVLIIGQYLSQLDAIADVVKAPIITGRTPNKERERLYGQFRRGELKQLVVSKVANFAIDLPDANVAIQVSGTFGSRQEEAQRLGRILRPKADGGQARFYTLVTKDTREQEFSANRQLFLTEQG
ncbi:MAG TPA: DNA repair helicase XPB, partial [Armatimonadota bacterium]|nr:DNA repair helicase XPB [Armatimonadota bacterium]